LCSRYVDGSDGSNDGNRARKSRSQRRPPQGLFGHYGHNLPGACTVGVGLVFTMYKPSTPAVRPFYGRQVIVAVQVAVDVP